MKDIRSILAEDTNDLGPWGVADTVASYIENMNYTDKQPILGMIHPILIS